MISFKKSQLLFVIVASGVLSVVTIGIWYYKQCFPRYYLTSVKEYRPLIPVAVIGGGPAGLSAALYTARAQLKTIVFAGAQAGGELMGVKEIENWPGKEKMSGMQVMDDMIQQADHFGAQVINEQVVAIDVSRWPFAVRTEGGKLVYALSVILAMGGIAKRLAIPGAQEYWGKGVGSCTICEAPFQKGKDVAVVGGGDTSAERARQLAVYANKVYMIVREEKLQACATVQDYLKALANIQILLATSLEEIKGNDQGVTGMIIKDLKTSTKKEVPIGALYFAIGYTPNSALVSQLVTTDRDGFICVECLSQKTSVPGVFAAGNVAASDKAYGKAGVATGSGVKAGMDAISFLESLGYSKKIEQELAPQFYHDSSQPFLPLILSAQELEAYQKKQPSKMLLLYFFADHCPTCRKMGAALLSMQSGYEGKIAMIKVDQSKSTDINKKYQVTAVPTVVILKNDAMVWQKTGMIDEKLLKEKLDEIVTR